MIEVMLDIGADGQVVLYNVAWPTVEEDGFGVGVISSIEGDLEAALASLGGNPLALSNPRQILAVSNYLFENFQLVSSRVIILQRGVETSQIEYYIHGGTEVVVVSPEPLPPFTRVNRYERPPVI